MKNLIWKDIPANTQNAIEAIIDANTHINTGTAVAALCINNYTQLTRENIGLRKQANILRSDIANLKEEFVELGELLSDKNKIQERINRLIAEKKQGLDDDLMI